MNEMELDLRRFQLWLTSELKIEYDRSSSSDFNTRKSANLRIDELRMAQKVLDDFLKLHPSP